MPTIVIRSLLGRVATLIVAVAAMLVLVEVCRSDGPWGMVPFLGWGGLLGVCVWGLWWAPLLVLSDGGVRVRNMWRSYRIGWEDIEGTRSRWVLVLLLSQGREVSVSAAQRPGGLSHSWNAGRQVRRQEMFGRAGRSGQAVARALENSAVREEYLDPSDAVFRTHMDCASAADLIEAYRARREVHTRVRARQEQRAQRMDRARREHGDGVLQEGIGACAGARAAGDNDGPERLRGRSGWSRQPAWLGWWRPVLHQWSGQDTSRLNVGVILAVVVSLLVVIISTVR